MSRARLAIVAGVLLVLAGVCWTAITPSYESGQFGFPLLFVAWVIVDYWRVTSGFQLMVQIGGAHGWQMVIGLPIAPLVVMLIGVGLAAVWWPQSGKVRS